MATKRRRFTAEFKAKVVLEALRGDRAIQAISAKHEVHPNQVSGWKRQAQAGLRALFGDGTDGRQKQHDATIHHPACQDRRVDRGARLFSTWARALSRAERRGMIEREDERLSVQLVGLNRCPHKKPTKPTWRPPDATTLRECSPVLQSYFNIPMCDTI